MTGEATITERNGSSTTELKAILFLDLVQSSRLMDERETETIEFLERSFAIFRDNCEEHGGQLIKSTGDGALIIFSSAIAAINYSIEVHKKVEKVTGSLGSLAAFRAGVHIGEVLSQGHDVYGSAVNVAARLEGLAEPGGISISEDVYRLVKNNPGLRFEIQGKHKLKNISGKMLIYNVVDQSVDVERELDAALRITTIGGLAVSTSNNVVSVPKGTKSRGLLGYLSAASDRTESLGTLASILWPDRSESDANKLLNGILRRLAAIVPMSRHGFMLGLNEERVLVDLPIIEKNLISGIIDPVLNRNANWPDQILMGYENTGSLFASWLEVTRNDWRLRISSALEDCLERFELSSNNMRDAATALLRLEPGHERAARRLIRYHHAVGNPGAAKRVFDQLTEQLQSSLGISPKEETVAASKGLQAKLSPEVGRSASQPLRIQVGDIVASSETGNGVANGFRNELLSGLASFRGWSVVECEQHSSVGSQISDYKLFGEYFEDSRELSLSLTDPNGGRTVWSERIELDTNYFQSAKREVIGRVAATLEVYLSTDRLNSPAKNASHSAIDAWLKGERLHTRWTPQDNDDAAEIFETLIELEPEFAPSYASLASVHNVRHIVRPGIARDAVASKTAYRLANRAVELDPLDARNQLAIAWSASLEGDFDKATLHMKMAARLNPNCPRTIISCAMGFAFFGDHLKAGELLDHCLICSPIMLEHHWCYAASVYFLAGNFDEALVAVQRGRDRIIDNPGWHAATLVKLGKEQEATIQFKNLVRSISANWHRNEPATPQSVADWFVNAYPLRRMEERNLLMDALEEVVEEGYLE